MTVQKTIESLYIHVPFCRHLCNYCDFHKRIPNSEEDYSNYEEILEESFLEHDLLLNEKGYGWGALETLYLGGGTPSLWGERGARFLSQALRKKNIHLSDNVEATLEVNPGSWTDDGLQAWQDFGINRFSLGIQSLDSYFLKVLDRVHSLEDVHVTLKKFQEMRANFSVDFMLGLPFSKTGDRNIEAELKEILKYDPAHLSLYILTVKDQYIHHQELPDEEWVEQEYLLVSRLLKERGYEHYEVSNFAKKGKTSKHNLRYWQSRSVGALGPSATGFLSESRLRYKWKNKTANYESEQLNEDEFKLEQLYMGLRTNEGLDLYNFIPKTESSSNLLQKWDELGYLDRQAPLVKLSSKGYLMLDSLLSDLFLLSK